MNKQMKKENSRHIPSQGNLHLSCLHRIWLTVVFQLLPVTLFLLLSSPEFLSVLRFLHSLSTDKTSISKVLSIFSSPLFSFFLLFSFSFFLFSSIFLHHFCQYALFLPHYLVFLRILVILSLCRNLLYY